MLSQPLPWLLLAAALALAGGAPRPVRGRHGSNAWALGGTGVIGNQRAAVISGVAVSDESVVRPHRRLSRRALTLGAAMAAGAASLAVGGLPRGLIAAVVLAPSAAAIASRLADRPAARRPAASLAPALDLAAAALRSGQSVPTALSLTAPVLPEPLAAQWRRTAALLALGADPAQAWAVLGEDAALAPVATAARRSADSGARLARTFTQLAADTRATVRADALARANRAGVFEMAPLGLCFLPAFICLGIVPTVVGVAQGVLR